jgi:RNA polymerase sigma-70 factor (ECF subfamily)
VLDESLGEIAVLLDVSVDAVKGHLARGRSRLREVNARALAVSAAPPASADALRYVALFHARDWDALRAMLAEDVKLNQATRPLRTDRATVGMFFTIYATYAAVRLVPAWLEGREVIAVFESGAGDVPDYVTWLEWREGRVTYIHDYRYARYVFAEARVSLPA